MKLLDFVGSCLLFLFPLLSRSLYIPHKLNLKSLSRHQDIVNNAHFGSSNDVSAENEEAVSGNYFLSRVKAASKVLYKFSRPHTIKGTILASVMGVSRALMESPGKLSLKLVPRALLGLFALLCGNAYIVGINQIYDVKIDEVITIHILYITNEFCAKDQ